MNKPGRGRQLVLNVPAARRVVRFPLIHAKAVVSATAPLAPASRGYPGRGRLGAGRAQEARYFPLSGLLSSFPASRMTSHAKSYCALTRRWDMDRAESMTI
jgi:hypothetical protein